MTSLAHQLKRLALPQSDGDLLTGRQVASLLFDPKDAATMDRHTFYALGCTGLEELLGIEPALLEFQDTLFSRASITLERSVQSRDVNQKLDADISLFLTRLCPYFLLKPAHKCIEWLVHRFHIHLYNPDSLLACSLPYHQTNMFVRVLQLLRIKDATSRWNWLHGLQKPGVPLARGTLITHCCTNLSFMDFICTMVTNSIQAYSGLSGSCSQLRVIFSFYASTIVSTLDAADPVSDAIISKLLPYVHMGLKSSLTDYKAATYMVVCQLAVKVVMESSLVDTLAVLISRSLLKEPVLTKEGIGCLIVLLQRQKQDAAGSRFCGRLCSAPALAPTLRELAVTHDVSPLLGYLLPYLVHAAFHSPGATEELDLLQSILQDVPLINGLDQTIARLLLEDFLSQTEGAAGVQQRMQPLVRLFESRYGGALDAVISSHMVNVSSPDSKRLFHQFLSLTLSSGKYQILGDSDTSLLLSLKHPQVSVRLSAVTHLMDAVAGQKQSLDQRFLKDAVLERVKDDEPEVVTPALRVLEMLLDVLESDDVLTCLLSLLNRTDESERWLPVVMQAVHLLSDPRLGQGDGELQQKVVLGLLPFLVITASDPAQLRLTSCVARSAVLRRHPLTLDWAQELDEVLKRSSGPDLLGVLTQRLVSTLTRNLANMEPFYKRDTLEQLAQAAEGQRRSDRRDRTFFLVTTHTLLLSLSELRDTEHLLTAHRVYVLLEPLLELLQHCADQQAAGPLALPASFPDALAIYLSRCGHQLEERWDSGYDAVVLSLLRDFITALRCPDASFRGEMWWNPECLDTNTCCYLGLLCRLFSVILSGAGEGPASGSFRELMKLLLQVHLPEPPMLFRFLCLLWGYGSNHGNQLDVTVGAVLQTQALYLGKALLAALPPAALDQLAANDSPVVPTLLCCLISEVQEVRRSAFGALRNLSGASTSPFQPIIEKLLTTSEEIIADPSYLSTALSVCHAQSQSAAVMQSALHQLLRSVNAPCCPSYSAASLLRTLSHVDGESVLSALLPVLERLLQSGPDTPPLLRSEAQLLQLILGKFNEASAPLLVHDQKCLDLFIRALRTRTGPLHHIPSCQFTALEQITKSFFSAVADEVVQQKLLSVLFDLLVDSTSPPLATAVSSVFKAVAVDGQLVANELVPPPKPDVSATVQQTRRSRLLRRTPDAADVPGAGGPSWQRVILILELLQHKKKLKRAQTLVPVLFSLLARSLEAESSDGANMEYSKQLLLSCLLNVCHKLSPDGRTPPPDVLDEDKLNVELVVQCIRTSDVPQTHHQALLLLGTVASIFPDKVLHNIMAIFTFMGANVMRLDDAYSFRVIDQTVQMVIPALIQGTSSAHVDAVVTRIMHVFVDALPHVPEHRRLPVLKQLVTTLGPTRFLWVLMLLLFKLHATQAVGEKDGALDRDMDFWVCVCCQFAVGEQLATLVSILHFLLQLPDDKDDAAPATRSSAGRGAQNKEEEEEQLIFSLDAHSSKELRHFKFLCVSFMAQLLASAGFIGKVAGGGEADELLQQRLLEHILRYIHTVARCVEENADKSTAKFWRVLLNKTYEVLDKVNALLPADTFITVTRGLMGNQLASVRRKSMELLNNKLQQRAAWDPRQVGVLLELTDDLLTVVGRGRTAVEQAVNRQTALYSLKLLCRNLGPDHRDSFVPVLLRVTDLIASEEEDKSVTSSALLCAAELVGALKALAIPQLPRLMPAVLHALADRKQMSTSEVHLLSAVTTLQRIAETLPHFISPYLQETTAQVCWLTNLVDSAPPSSHLSQRVSALRSALALQLPPRVLLPVISRCHIDMVIDRKDQLGALTSLLKEHVSHMDRDQVSNHQSELTAFFLTALDFRAQHCQGDLARTAQIEACVMDCLVVMVMKLSEVTFRPLFFKMFDWSKSGSKERQLTFCRLAHCFAERLRGLFVLFAGNLVKPFADVLRQSGDVFDSEHGVEKSCLLLQNVLDCLCKIFLYDTQRFLSRERADALLPPLIDQLENLVGGTVAYQQRVTAHLVPCVGQFAVALADDTQWKKLNYQILLKTRHSDAKVRFSALLMLLEVATKLKENYMVLLPETIPFLAELMEDECEEVEQQVQKVVQEMESILGEPLQSYF